MFVTALCIVFSYNKGKTLKTLKPLVKCSFTLLGLGSPLKILPCPPQ